MNCKQDILYSGFYSVFYDPIHMRVDSGLWIFLWHESDCSFGGFWRFRRALCENIHNFTEKDWLIFQDTTIYRVVRRGNTLQVVEMLGIICLQKRVPSVNNISFYQVFWWKCGLNLAVLWRSERAQRLAWFIQFLFSSWIASLFLIGRSPGWVSGRRLPCQGDRC